MRRFIRPQAAVFLPDTGVERPEGPESGSGGVGRLVLLSALNAIALALLWIIEQFAAERYPRLVWLTYMPQQPLGIPLLVLLLWSAGTRSWRLFAANMIAAALFTLSFLGFCLPLGARETPGAQPIRILTLNTHVGSFGADRIAALIQDQQPDVVCLQETRAWRGNPDPVPAILARLTGWQVARVAEVTTLSRYPLLSSRAIPLIPGWDRAALETRIRFPHAAITLFNVHYFTGYAGRPVPSRSDSPRLAPRALARWEQTTTLLAAVDAHKGPIVVAGDFNNPPRGLVYRRLTEGLIDAFRTAGFGFGYTFRADIPLMRIDYIFASRDVHVHRCYTVHSGASDHRAVVADISCEQ